MPMNSAINSFLPPYEIWTSLLAGLSVTFFLLLFSKPPFRLPLLIKRYGASTGAGFFLWLVLLYWGEGASFLRDTEKYPTLLAGALLIWTAVFCNYYLGNISAGFRIEILVNLAQANKSISLEQWMALYGKGAGMRYFLEDRLKTTLISWNLATQSGDQITLTPLGRFGGRVNSFFAHLFSEVKNG